MAQARACCLAAVHRVLATSQRRACHTLCLQLAGTARPLNGFALAARR